MIYHYLVFKNNAVQSTTTQICTSAVHCIGQCITWLGCIAPQAVHSIGQCIALSSWCIAGCDRGEHEVGELPAANSTQLHSTSLNSTQLHMALLNFTSLYSHSSHNSTTPLTKLRSSKTPLHSNPHNSTAPLTQLTSHSSTPTNFTHTAPFNFTALPNSALNCITPHNITVYSLTITYTALDSVAVDPIWLYMHGEL